MKLFLLGLMVSTLTFAGELKTSFSESSRGFEFSLYELSYPEESNRLWDFINSLHLSVEMNGMSLKREYVSGDKDFIFKCIQTYATKGVNEARCYGSLIKSVYPTSLATMFDGSPKFLSVIFREKMAENFSGILTKQNGVIFINLKDKFVITGSDLYIEMQVRE